MATEAGAARFARAITLVALLIAVSGCERSSPAVTDGGVTCDVDNGGLELPVGFCALVVTDHLAGARHLVVSEDGDVYVSLRIPRLDFGGIAVLRDSDHDGRADLVEQFGEEGGVGIALHGGYLYFGADARILRYRREPGELVPAAAPEVVVDGFPAGGYHSARTFAFTPDGGLLVNIGAPSNACQIEDRVPGSAGRAPCPELRTAAGIWRYAADALGQHHPGDGQRHASGIRHVLAVDRSPADGELYVIQHGRDELHQNWPASYDARQGQQLPAEEMLRVRAGDDFGWPYCYFDGLVQRRVLAPEYGGDGVMQGRCDDYPPPVAALPAHAGPNAMVFYRGDQFPARYRDGAFVALHGAYLRADGSRAGSQVAFIPMAGGGAGAWEVFAQLAAGDAPGAGPAYRPTGLALGPDGSLYVADSESGRVWRIVYPSGR